MSAELDMSQYLDLFLQEAEEQLEVLEQETVKLEEDPSQERMQAIFRAAHTLKGSSRAMGFAKFAELTHEVENVLDLLRGGAISVTTESADCLLASIDTLVQMKNGIAQGEGDGKVETGLLVEQLQAIGGAEPAAAPAKSKKPPSCGIPPEIWDALDQASLESPVFHAKIKLASDCAMKFVRVFMAANAVQTDGELLATHPIMEDLEEERFGFEFELALQTRRDPEELRQEIAAITEIESLEWSLWARPKAEEEDEEDEEDSSLPSTLLPSAPAAEASKAADGTTAPLRKEPTQTVRVDVTRLDALMNLVGELVIDRTRISQIGTDLSRKYSDPHVDALSETVSHIARITSDLQDQIMKARMMPIETVFNRLPRMVRDLANKLGKEVKLELVGGDTELDRSVIEVIGDPLIHLIRNSLDHGLEMPNEREEAGKPAQGLLMLTAKHLENHIVIEIRDDGKGIDPEKIRAKALEKGQITPEALQRLSDKEVLQLIFASGFSTAKEVSEVSGRGVGMDIVRSNLAKLGGMIDLESAVGKGTVVTLRLPLTLAIIRGLLVRVNGSVYVLPLGSVVETLLLKEDEVQRLNRQEVILLRGVTTPLVRVDRIFKTKRSELKAKTEESYVVIVGLAELRVGLVVDELIGEQEVVIKSLSRFVGDTPGLSGATILGDGNVALIVDVNSLVPMDRG
jgi:two-component system, chemotaxis family, sensor kinase CheA